ncbi:MAG: GspE/PulE family protein [Patescibacteria group bacterium]|nr:GspE/PulE family protein [Patescibacteria group bacterium]
MTEENKNQTQGQTGSSAQTVGSGGAPLPSEAPIQQERPSGEGSEYVLSQVNRGFKERALMEKAKELGISYVDIEKMPINPDLLYILTPDVAEKAMVMPFFRVGQKLRVAVADPNGPYTKTVLDDLRGKGYQLNINLASEESIKAALKLYQGPQYRTKKELVTKVEEQKLQAYEKEVENLSALKEKIQKSTSEEALNLIDIGAVKSGASDIHYEPEEKSVRIRFRIDGILHKIFDLDKNVFKNVANQIKYKAKMKMNVTNEPQDGRYHFILNDRKIDVRVSALPTEFGETFACRLLDNKKKIYKFEDIGFAGRYLETIQRVCEITQGMILVTGPTGSGKTTTLYTLLGHLNTPENKIITLEDPIEYHLEGISQSQINEKRGYTFASGLRSILRQDPDVVMLGEIRDKETAETAAQAALTGHVLLSTLHTNSVVETIPRLVNIGLPEFMIAPSLYTIIAERLVRKLCPDCQEEKEIPESERIEFGKILSSAKEVQPELNIEIPAKLFYPKGCEKCSHTGYRGRLNVIEMLVLDDELKNAILQKLPASELFKLARNKGMITMEEDGIIKALQGKTTLEEVHRVIQQNV